MLYHSTSFSILKSTTWVFLFIILPCSCINKDTNLFIDKGNLLSFKFEKRLNPQLEKDIELPIYTSHNKLTGYLTAPSINSSNLIASFSTEKGNYISTIKSRKAALQTTISEKSSHILLKETTEIQRNTKSAWCHTPGYLSLLLTQIKNIR